MAATTAGALKALIEAAGLGIPAYRDEAPDDAPERYVVVYEGISTTPDPSNNRYDDDKQVREQAQVTVWQRWRDLATKAVVESYTLAPALEALLDGAELPSSPTRNWAVLLRGTVRFPPNRDTNQVQTVLTVELVRDL